MNQFECLVEISSHFNFKPGRIYQYHYPLNGSDTTAFFYVVHFLFNYIIYVKFNTKFLHKVFYLLINASTCFGFECWLPGQHLRPNYVGTLLNKQKNFAQQVGFKFCTPRLLIHNANAINSEYENKWHCFPPENVNTVQFFICSLHDIKK